MKETKQILEFVAVVQAKETKLNLDFTAGTFGERTLNSSLVSRRATPLELNTNILTAKSLCSAQIWRNGLTKPNLEFTTGIARQTALVVVTNILES
jgi:hypothetical protein